MKQYLAGIMWKSDEKEGKWTNAHKYRTGKQYAESREEAEKSIEYCKQKFNQAGRKTTTKCGSFAVESEIDEQTASDLSVVKSFIKVREVTEWEILIEE